MCCGVCNDVFVDVCVCICVMICVGKLDWARAQGGRKVKKAEQTASQLRAKFQQVRSRVYNTSVYENTYHTTPTYLLVHTSVQYRVQRCLMCFTVLHMVQYDSSWCIETIYLVLYAGSYY